MGKETIMHPITSMAALAALAALAGCAARQVEATPPTVTYAFDSRSGYEEVARRADRYCDERYDLDAYLVDRGRVSGGYEATFACE